MIAYIFAIIRLQIKFMLMMRRDVFQAIADPTRRTILGLIALQAMTPNMIAEQFDKTRQAVSNHIKILTECQLLEKQQSGREIYYQLNPNKLREIADWLAPFQKLWDDRFERLDNVLSNLKSNKNDL